MKQKNDSPSVLRDVTAMAGLYRDVAWMFGQRVRRGPEWQQKLFDESVRLQAMEDMREREVSLPR